MAGVGDDRVFVASAGPSARGPKWTDQLGQVESRLLANWEEFTTHRSEVLARLQDLQDALRRGVRQDPHAESEIERCSRRVQQLWKSHEETAVRVGDVKAAVDASQQSVEGLRSRLASKLQELGAAFEETQREVSRISEDVLRETTASTKRHTKAVADELLRKMSELNTKLGENMATMEEQTTSRCEGLRTEVQEILARLENAGPRAAESELRRTEAHFDAQWRALRNDLQGQMDELTRSTRSELGRLRGLQTQSEEGARRLDAVLAESATGRQKAERVESQLEELRGVVARLKEETRTASAAQQSDFEDQLCKLRDEISASAAKDLRSQTEAMADLQRRHRLDVDSVQELVERHRGETAAELQALKTSDADCQLQLEQLSQAAADLSEGRKGLVKEVDDCRAMDRQIEDAVRRMEIRIERISSAAAQCLEGLDAAERSASVAERKAGELKERSELQNESLEALKSADADRQAQMDRLVGALTELGESHKGIRADVESFRSVDRRHVEEALSRIDARLERLAATAAQNSEGQADIKAFAREAAEKVALDARDLVEQRSGELRDLFDRQSFDTAGKIEALNVLDAERLQQLDQVSKACSDLAEARRGLQSEVEQGRASDRRQAEEVSRRLEQRLEALSTSLNQCSTGLADARTQSRELVDLRATELKDQLSSLRDSLGGAAQEALNLARRHESLEELTDRRFGEERRELEALKSSDAERQKQLDRLTKALGEQSEARKGVASDLERCQASDRQHADTLRRLETRLEALAASSVQMAEGVAEAKVFAREAAEKAQVQAKELLEQRATELKDQAERRAAEAAAKFQALQAADSEREQRLQELAKAGAEAAAARKGLLAEVEKCQSIDRQLQDELRRVDARLEKVSAVAVQSSEGLAEVKAFAREATDRTAILSKEQLELRSAELKELFERRATETSTKLEVLRAADAERSQALDRLSKVCAEQNEARKGIVADVEHCQSSDRQLEDALKRVDAKVESAASVAAQCTEGVAEVRVFAREAVDKASTQSKELLELRSAELKAHMTRLHEELSKQTSKELQSQSHSLAELSRRAEQRAEALQELIERRCSDNASKVEVSALASQSHEGLAEMKAFARDVADKAAAQSREQLEQRTGELKELVEQRSSESNSRMEAAKAADAEQNARAEQLARDLVDLRRGLMSEIEKCLAADRQLEDALKRSSQEVARCGEGLGEVRSFAREAAEKASTQLKEVLELRSGELKELFEKRAGEGDAKVEALRAQQRELREQLGEVGRNCDDLAEARRGLLVDVEEARTFDRRQEDALQRLAARVDRLGASSAEMSQGIAEVRLYVRESAESVVAQTKARQDASTEDAKATFEELRTQLQASMAVCRNEAGERETRLAARLSFATQEAQELRGGLEEHSRRQEILGAELRQILEDRVAKVNGDIQEQKDMLQSAKDGLRKYIGDALRKSEQKLQALTAQPRVLGLVMDQMEGLVRGVTKRELETFQREAIDGLEWKLERCVQWLHGANVKLGLNPQGTLFSTDRFRDMLFDDTEPLTGRVEPVTSARGRSHTARVRVPSTGKSARSPG